MRAGAVSDRRAPQAATGRPCGEDRPAVVGTSGGGGPNASARKRVESVRWHVIGHRALSISHVEVPWAGVRRAGGVEPCRLRRFTFGLVDAGGVEVAAAADALPMEPSEQDLRCPFDD